MLRLGWAIVLVILINGIFSFWQEARAEHARLGQRIWAEIVEKLIVSATTRDAFADNLPYINVRTLTNSLGQIKAQASAPVSEAMVEAEA